MLLWNAVFTATSSAFYSSHRSMLIAHLIKYLGLSLYFLPAMAADLWLGRHRSMLWATTIAWLALAVVSLLAALSTYLPSVANYSSQIQIAWYTVLFLCRAVFESNVVQFGVDQFPEGSSDEFSSFVHWYVFTYFVGQFFCSTSYSLLRSQPLWIPLSILAVLFTVLLVLLYCKSNCFIKEPPNKAAYSKIYQVLRYAWKHKFPERRAFLYWNEKSPSRIDLGKCTNGGPFTCEQVEDVKTFLKLFWVVFVLFGLFLGLGGWFEFAINELMFIHLGTSSHTILEMNNQVPAVTAFVYVIFHEFAATTFFRKYFPNILQRLWIASLCGLLGSVGYLLIDARAG